MLQRSAKGCFDDQPRETFEFAMRFGREEPGRDGIDVVRAAIVEELHRIRDDDCLAAEQAQRDPRRHLDLCAMRRRRAVLRKAIVAPVCHGQAGELIMGAEE